MDEATQRVIVSMRGLIEANRNARVVMTQAEQVLVAGIQQLESGVGIVDALKASSVASQRHDTQEALEVASAARHDLRLQIMAVCLEEGLTPREIAELWGISRQRADRFVQELKKGTPD